MGRELFEARRIVQLCRSKRLIAAVNFQLRFAPNMLVLQHHLAGGKLGAVVDVEIRTRVGSELGNAQREATGASFASQKERGGTSPVSHLAVLQF
jgi:predicted dehydrogenase